MWPTICMPHRTIRGVNNRLIVPSQSILEMLMRARPKLLLRDETSQKTASDNYVESWCRKRHEVYDQIQLTTPLCFVAVSQYSHPALLVSHCQHITEIARYRIGRKVFPFDLLKSSSSSSLYSIPATSYRGHSVHPDFSFTD